MLVKCILPIELPSSNGISMGCQTKVFIHSFVHSLSKYFLKAPTVLGIMLGPSDTVMKKAMALGLALIKPSVTGEVAQIVIF